jgi:hypothetical protein
MTCSDGPVSEPDVANAPRPVVPSSLHGWVAAVLPADTRSVRVAQPELASTLREAGADVSGESAAVEIVGPADFRGEAEHAIVFLDAGQPEGGARALRIGRRLTGAARIRLEARRWLRRLSSAGYRSTYVVPWDVEHFVYLPGVRGSLRPRRMAEHFPQRAIVVGSRSQTAPTTVLQAVAAEAAAHIGRPLSYGWPLARAGILVALTPECALRVAVGPGRLKLELQRAALESLRRADPPELVARRIPWALASGRTGLADWSADQRLPGRTSTELSETETQEALEFLVALFATDGGKASPALMGSRATVIAGACVGELQDTALRVGARLDELLTNVPRGFAHGDFWSDNLLVEHGHLSGVVDWDGAGPGRLPLLDLFHLQLSAQRERTRKYLGAALLDELLPSLRAGDPLVARYCERIGIRADAALLEHLAIAYWLDRVAFELRVFGDRALRPLWMQENVHRVLERLPAESSVAS